MPHRKNGTIRRVPMGIAANFEPRTVRGRTDSLRTFVAIRARGIEVDEALDRYIRERCGFKLGKFAKSIDRISVRLEDVGGPKGAPSMRCAVKVVLSRHESIVVEVVEGDHRSAFDHAIDAAERAVKRTRDRSREKARRI